MKSFNKAITPYFSKDYWKGAVPCFYCQADSFELKLFLILVIGGLAGASLFFAIGLWLKGTFKNTEDQRDEPLKLE
jgi:hypothetical protein